MTITSEPSSLWKTRAAQKAIADADGLLRSKIAHQKREEAILFAQQLVSFDFAKSYGREINDMLIACCDLRRSIMSKCTFSRLLCIDVLMEMVEMDEISIDEGYFVRTKVDWLSLRQSKLANAVVSESSFRSIGAESTDFSNSFIQYADFRFASLARAKFTGAKLYRCDFRHADLTAANFDGARIYGCKFAFADLRSASIDSRTRLGDTTYYFRQKPSRRISEFFEEYATKSRFPVGTLFAYLFNAVAVRLVNRNPSFVAKLRRLSFRHPVQKLLARFQSKPIRRLDQLAAQAEGGRRSGDMEQTMRLLEELRSKDRDAILQAAKSARSARFRFTK